MLPATIPFIRTGWTLVIIGPIFAFFNYQRTNQFKQRTGVSPWHIPPAAWAFVSLFISLVGTVLARIAMSTTKLPPGVPRYQGSFSGRGRHPGRGYGQGMPPGHGQQGYPTTQAQAPGYAQGPHPGYPPPQPGYAPPTPPPSTPASWFADPTGRHQARYFDGTAWTAHVANDGVSATDPL